MSGLATIDTIALPIREPMFALAAMVPDVLPLNVGMPELLPPAIGPGEPRGSLKSLTFLALPTSVSGF